MIGWIKGIGICLLVAAINMMGIRLAGLYKQRLRFWEQMEDMAGYFYNEIRYTGDSPEKIFKRYVSADPQGIWQGSPSPDQSFFSYFKTRVDQVGGQLFLSSQGREALNHFGLGLGTTDLEGQLCHCENSGRVFQGFAASAREAYNRKGKLYRTLCLLASVAVAIIVI